MKKINVVKSILFAIAFSCCCTNGYSAEVDDGTPYATYKPSEYSGKRVVYNWYSEEGQKRLHRSSYKKDYYQIAPFFAPQVYPTFCGVASSVMVLNAMRIPKGVAPVNSQLSMVLPKALGGGKKDFRFYTQETFFNNKTESVKARTLIEVKNVTPDNENDAANFDPGLTLVQLKSMLEAHDAHVDIYYADEKEEAGTKRFRDALKTVLSETEKFLIVNLLGTPLGMNSGGHISPVAAYDSVSDSVLIFEVAAAKRPWLWVPVRDLYLSMNTKDGLNHRGYLIVSEGL